MPTDESTTIEPTAAMEPPPAASAPGATPAASGETSQAAEVVSEPPVEEVVDPMASVVFAVDEETVDEDGYVSIWNVAATTMGGQTVLARQLASKMLGFLCKQQVDFVVISSTDANYLDEWFERDTSLLYDWSATSEKVDVVAQHAQVPAKALLQLLQQKKFDATKNHNPRRADRVQWFSDLWCIG